MLKQICQIAVMGAVAVGLCGCPQLNPPFDTTGSYAGTFTLGAGDTQLAEGCDITLELEQNVDAVPLENSKVSGTVSLSFLCTANPNKATIEEILSGALGQLLSTGPVEVSGAIGPNGTLSLATADLLGDCGTEGCEKLLLVGTGKDTDDDGAMDEYSGTVGGIVEVSGAFVPLVGTFTTEVAE